MAGETVITHSVRLSWTGMGSASLSGTISRTADAEDNRIIPLTGSQADKEVNMNITASRMKMLFILATKAALIENNDSGTPVDTITLAGTVPYWWDATSGIANPFTEDVTKLYLSNLSGDAAQVDIRVLYDSTP